MDGSPLALPYAGQDFAQRKRADARFAIAETKRQTAKAVHRACLVGRGKAKKGSSDGGGKANRIVREI
jgi:hypothetical protein